MKPRFLSHESGNPDLKNRVLYHKANAQRPGTARGLVRAWMWVSAMSQQQQLTMLSYMVLEKPQWPCVPVSLGP